MTLEQAHRSTHPASQADLAANRLVEEALASAGFSGGGVYHDLCELVRWEASPEQGNQST